MNYSILSYWHYLRYLVHVFHFWELGGTCEISLLEESDTVSLDKNEASEDLSTEDDGPIIDSKTGSKISPLNNPKMTVKQKT